MIKQSDCTQSHPPKRRTTTKLAGHNDQSQKQERGPVIAIQLPAHLFDLHLVQTPQPALLPTPRNLDQMPVSLLTMQASDQATPRQEHVHTFQQLRQIVAEWHMPLWVAAIDFKKGIRQGIQESYTQTLTKLHDKNRAKVHTDGKSKQFHLKQGTKLGDPSLIHYIMKASIRKVDPRPRVRLAPFQSQVRRRHSSL